MKRLTVGLLLLLAACAQPTRTPGELPDDEPHIDVMTYNVNYGLAGDEETLNAIEESGADIVFLQETTPAWMKRLRTLRATYPHMAFHHCCGAGGLAFLSKYPFEDGGVIEPPSNSWFPAWRATFETPIGKVQGLNVHLRPPFSDSGSVVVGYFTTPEIRRAEIEKFYAELEPEVPTIVAGDFNEDEDGSALGFLKAKGLTTALPEFQPSADTWRWSTSVGSVSSRLDHVAYDPRLRPVNARVRETGRSDHLPVVATFVRESR